MSLGRVAVFGAFFGLAGMCALTALATTSPPQLTTRAIPGLGVTVALPRSWVGATPPPSVAGLGVKYFYRAPQVISGFRANLNLIVAPLPAGMSLRQWMFQGASSALQYVGKTTSATISGVRGLHYESTKAEKHGSAPLLTDDYAVVRAHHVFLFTYTALASTRARYESTFSASAATIRIAAHPLSRATA